MITTAIANTKVYPITKMSIILSLLTMSNIVAIIVHIMIFQASETSL
jgi:hypothetical protein